MNSTPPQRVTSPWPSIAPFAIVAGLSVIAGGLVAAIVAHDPSRHAVWAAAYLVLVVGVIQFALAAGQALLTVEPPPAAYLGVECAVLNTGNACVVAGTLLGLGFIVNAGGALLIVALLLFLYGVRGAGGGWLMYTYRGLLVFVLVSIVAGLVISAQQP